MASIEDLEFGMGSKWGRGEPTVLSISKVLTVIKMKASM
jgi:hypothetical protein